jgi:hypothetical protein
MLKAMSPLPSAISAGRDCPRRPLAALFALDVRSLAAMRIGLGLVLLLNLYGLVVDVPAFYTDGGMLSRANRLELNVEEQFTAPPHWISLHMLSGEAPLQYLLFGLSAAGALGVLVGYHTGWALLGSWILLSGLQGRNPLPLHGGDDVLRCLLLWCIFLPLGATWSFDRRNLDRRRKDLFDDRWQSAAQAGIEQAPRSAGQSPAEPIPLASRATAPAPPTHAYSVASAALVIQLGCIYFFTGILKSHPHWRSEFSALYYALGTDHLTTPLGSALMHYPTVLKWLTAGTLLLELVGPLALLCPWRAALVRTVLVAAFWSFHLGIAATFHIGLFPFTCMVYWSAVLPSEFWDAIAAAWNRRRTSACRPDMVRAPTARITEALAATLLCGVLLLNYVRLANSVYAGLQSGPLRILTEAAQLNQFWCMFSPRPPDFGGWFNIRGTLADGTQVNLLRPGEPTQDARPPQVSATYASSRWSKLLMTLYERDCPTYRRGVGEYLCRRWNASHGPEQQLVAAEILLIIQPTPPPGAADAPPRPTTTQVIWRWMAPAHSTQNVDQLPGRAFTAVQPPRGP